MSEDVGVAVCEPTPWYHWWRFPVLPKVTVRQADEWNEWRFSFDWLVFRAWTLMSPSLELQVELGSTYAAFWILIPYMKLGISIPIAPMKFGSWVQRHFWRHGTRNIYA